MIGKTSGTRFRDVFLHSISAYGDADDIITTAECSHEVVAGKVWQTEVADHDVKRSLSRKCQCFFCATRSRDFVSRTLQEKTHAGQSICMIFDDQNATCRACSSAIPGRSANRVGLPGLLE